MRVADLRQAPTIGQSRVRTWGVRLLLALGAVPLLLPLVWMVSTSLKRESQVFKFPPRLIPEPLTLQAYHDILVETPFARQYVNSLYIAVLTVIGTAIVSSLAGYALARLRFPGRGLVLPILLTSLLLPIEVLIVPLYSLMSWLGWIGTPIPLIVEPVFGAPAVIGTFLMRQFFLSLPRDLEDAGRVDGLSAAGVFWRIALPLARPAIATLAILTFLASWNAYLEPLVFTSGDTELMTLPVAIGLFTDYMGQPYWTRQMAATTLSIVPMVVVFLLAQRQIVTGIARSGLKG
jgi:multiple sugar transport system permease protein